MAGLLRRLRRRGESTGEPTEAPSEETEATPSEGSSLSEEGLTEAARSEANAKGAPDTGGVDGPTPTSPKQGEATPPPPGPPAPAASTTSPEPPLVEGPPPPLPAADMESVRAATPARDESGRCFVCGTEMVGSYCPTCRMSWNE